MAKKKRIRNPSISLPAGNLVGFVSIKTIRLQNGQIVIHQGEQIREEHAVEFESDEIWKEVLANAMPRI